MRHAILELGGPSLGCPGNGWWGSSHQVAALNLMYPLCGVPF